MVGSRQVCPFPLLTEAARNFAEEEDMLGWMRGLRHFVMKGDGLRGRRLV